MAFAVMATQTHHCGIRWPWIDFFSFQVRFDLWQSLPDKHSVRGEAEAQPNFHDFHHVPRLHAPAWR